MKTTYNNIVKCGLMGVALLFGMAACSDDHFDVKDGTGTSAANTLWENIQTNGSTDSLALILQRTVVMRSETDFSGGAYYSDLLDAAQTYTAWAPKDGTYTAKTYLDMLDERDALLAADASSEDAWELNYKVAQQFLLNHVARYNYESNVDKQKVTLLNSKVAYYEAADYLFNSIDINRSLANIPSSNGTLHVLDGSSPFAYNIYDYLGNFSEMSTVWNILSDPSIETRTFSESQSTEGAMNENGEMVYVDSVYTTSNAILDACGASIKNEDSIYVALIPSDEGWDQAYETVSSIFKYGDSYCYDWDASAGNFLNVGPNALTFNADSLQEYNTNMAILKSSYFSATRFNVEDYTDSAQVNHYAKFADSLISTNGTIFYNSNQGGENPMFNGQDPYHASNGYIYAVDEYNVDPAYVWMSTITEKLRYSFYVACVKGEVTASSTNQGTLITLTTDTRNDSVKGELEDDMYRHFEVNGNSTMTIDIRMNNLYSGKYKISAEMVPNAINKSYITYDKKGNEQEQKSMFTAQVLDDAGNRIGDISPTITVAADSVDTYVLFESIEIPKCYVNLPSGYTTFPRLRFTMTPAFQNRGKCKALNISKIIIEPVREE